MYSTETSRCYSQEIYPVIFLLRMCCHRHLANRRCQFRRRQTSTLIICLYTINLPDAVTGCHSNSDAIMLLCRHCCHRPLPKRYRDPSVCLSVPARRNCLRRAAAIGHRAGRQRCADCGQNKIK